MSELKIGDKAPDFTLPTIDGSVKLSKLKGKTVVLYFYPKDNTSGCTKEAIGFEEHRMAFEKLGAVIIGVSSDTVKSHEGFAKKYDLCFILGSDETKEVLTAYGVYKEKSMYGRKFMGIERSTFVIDGKGMITKVYRKVKVTGHVEAVLADVKALS